MLPIVFDVEESMDAQSEVLAREALARPALLLLSTSRSCVEVRPLIDALL